MAEVAAAAESSCFRYLMVEVPSAADDQKSGAGGVPRDVVCIDAILRSMGVKEYDPKVIHQLLEFMYSKSILMPYYSSLDYFSVWFESVVFF